MADRHVLCCKACGTTLTRAVEIVLRADSESGTPDWTPKKPVTPPGQAFRMTQAYAWSTDPSTAVHLGHVPIEFLNVDDIGPSVKLTRKSQYLNGCCGLDGCDGPNQICQCGNEIGTLKSDCWTPHTFIPFPDGTRWEVESTP
tara:strand:+ start:724 stop:1152 length:429 start_codon:yes stop_codon:yes gene_type:complete